MKFTRLILLFFFICGYEPIGAIADNDSLLKVIRNSPDEVEVSHAKILLALKLMPHEMDSAYSLLNTVTEQKLARQEVIRADYFNAWGIYYWYKGMPDQAISRFMQTAGIKHAEEVLPQKAKAYNNIGVLYSQQGLADSARKYLYKSLDIDRNRNHLDGIAKTSYDLSVLHRRLDHNLLALTYILEAIRYQEMVSDYFRLANSYNVLGNIYLDLDSVASAIHNYNKAIDYALRVGSKSIQAFVYNNLSAIYCGRPDGFDSTLQYYNKAIALAAEMDNFKILISSTTNLGVAWLKKGDPHKALELFQLALQYFESVNYPSKEADVNLRIGLAKRELNDYDAAKGFFLRSLDIAKQIQSVSSQSKALLELAVNDSLQGDLLNAYKNYQQGIALRDSICNNRNRAKIAELQIIYQTDNKKLQIERLARENRLNKLLFLAGILVAILILLASTLLTKFYHKKQIIAKQNAIIQQQENERILITLETNKQELTGKALTIVKLEEVIKQFREELCLLLPQVDDGTARKIKEALNTIDANAKSQHLWKEFESRFNELNDGFINKLTNSYPNLSPSEIRLCAMLRMQLSSKEIAELSNRSPRTIEYTRTNIRKKMGLNSGDNLTKHLLSI